MKLKGEAEEDRNPNRVSCSITSAITVSCKFVKLNRICLSLSKAKDFIFFWTAVDLETSRSWLRANIYEIKHSLGTSTVEQQEL